MPRRLVIALALLALLPIPARAQHPDGCDWSQYGHDPGHSFAQAGDCTGIDPVTLAALVPKWVVRTGSPVTASPSVFGGTVYVGANDGTFYAVDSATGTVRWTFEVTDTNSVGFGRIVSSAAVHDVGGVPVVLFGGGATLYALDANSGAKLTESCVDPRADPAVRCKGSPGDIEIESSPAVVDVAGQTLVLVGMDVHNDRGVGRAGVIAFRLDSDPWRLAPLWKFDPETLLSYTTDPTKAGVEGFVHTADPLTHDAGNGDGCGGVWASPAVDAGGDMVFFGTSSCSYGETDDTPARLATESMFGVRLSSGQFVWTYSPRRDRGESTRLDDDFGASPNLLPHGLVGNAGKDGWYYARSRVDGAEAWSQHAGQSGHLTTDFAIGGMIGTPAVGDVFDEPAIFATTAISTPIGTPFDEFDEYTIDRTLAEDPGRMLSIHAFSAIDGRILWRSPLSRPSYGAPTYARDLVFVPSTVDFAVNVFHADTGVFLRKLLLNGAPASAPAVVGDSVYVGSGTSVDPFPFDDLSGIWAFELAV